MNRNPAKNFSMPSDVTRGNTIVTVYENSSVIIDNYKHIVTYEKNEVVVAGKGFTLRITGEGLSINYFTVCDIQITGRIISIFWS